MRALNVIFVGFLLVSSGFWRSLAAQEPAPRNQLTLDASFLAGGLSYARTTTSNNLVGIGAQVNPLISSQLKHEVNRKASISGRA